MINSQAVGRTYPSGAPREDLRAFANTAHARKNLGAPDSSRAAAARATLKRFLNGEFSLMLALDVVDGAGFGKSRMMREAFQAVESPYWVGYEEWKRPLRQKNENGL